MIWKSKKEPNSNKGHPKQEPDEQSWVIDDYQINLLRREPSMHGAVYHFSVTHAAIPKKGGLGGFSLNRGRDEVKAGPTESGAAADPSGSPSPSRAGKVATLGNDTGSSQSRDLEQIITTLMGEQNRGDSSTIEAEAADGTKIRYKMNIEYTKEEPLTREILVGVSVVHFEGAPQMSASDNLFVNRAKAIEAVVRTRAAKLAKLEAARLGENKQI